MSAIKLRHATYAEGFCPVCVEGATGVCDERCETRAVTGKRHEREDGRECFCGCQHVVGIVGTIVQDSDTPKLATLDLLIGQFMVPCPAGGRSRLEQVAYSYTELGLPVPA